MDAHKIADLLEALCEQDQLQPTDSKPKSATMMDIEMKSEPSEDPNQQNPPQMAASNFSLPIRTASEHIRRKRTLSSGGQSDTIEDTEQVKRNVTTFVTRYNALQLGSMVWKCRTCNQKATELIHLTSSRSPELGIIESAVSDMLIPVCTSNVCITKGNALVESLWICGAPDSETTSCESCGNRSRRKLCAGCRVTHVDKRKSFFTISGRGSTRIRSKYTGRGQFPTAGSPSRTNQTARKQGA